MHVDDIHLPFSWAVQIDKFSSVVFHFDFFISCNRETIILSIPLNIDAKIQWISLENLLF